MVTTRILTKSRFGPGFSMPTRRRRSAHHLAGGIPLVPAWMHVGLSGYIALGVFAVAAFTTLYVFQTAVTTQHSYEIDALRAERSRLLETQSKLQEREAALRWAPGRVDQEAQAAGMVRARPAGYLNPAGVPGGLLSPPTPARTPDPPTLADQIVRVVNGTVTLAGQPRLTLPGR